MVLGVKHQHHQVKNTNTRVVPVAGRFKTDSASGIKPVGNQELEKKSDNRPSTGFLKTGWKPVEFMKSGSSKNYYAKPVENPVVN